MLRCDEPAGYYLHNNICRNLKVHFTFTSTFSINVYNAYGRDPEGLGPCYFLQKDEVSIFRGRDLILSSLNSVFQISISSAQRSVMAAICILFFKGRFPTLKRA